jgi:hypothetical protein
MWQTLQQEAFIVGSVVVIAYQATKFSELNLADPTTSRYIALVPGAKVRDFAGSYAYHIGLALFLGASLAVYFLLCQMSPGVLEGAAKLLSGAEPPESLKAIPYPLYIAALFIGLTQPMIPIMSQFVNAQRDFFHDRINVPRRVIDISGALTNAIELRAGTDKRRLAVEVRTLAGGDFLTSLQSYGDTAYYKLQLEELQLEDEDAVDRAVRESSAKDLRGLVERLVLCALIAVMRRSGPSSLTKIAETLQARISTPPPDNFGYFMTSFVSSTVLFSLGLLVLALIFSLLVVPVTMLFPDPLAQGFLGRHEGSDPSCLLFASLLVALLFLVPRNRSQAAVLETNPDTSLAVEFVNFFRSSAVVLWMCMGITVLIKIGQMFYEYGTFSVPPEARSASRLILPVIQAFVPIAVCLFTTWYLVSSSSQSPRRGLSFGATLLAIAIAAGLVGFLYELAFVQEYYRGRSAEPTGGMEHVLFGVAANVLVSVCAFASVALFFTTCDRHRERSQNRGAARNVDVPATPSDDADHRVVERTEPAADRPHRGIGEQDPLPRISVAGRIVPAAHSGRRNGGGGRDNNNVNATAGAAPNLDR